MTPDQLEKKIKKIYAEVQKDVEKKATEHFKKYKKQDKKMQEKLKAGEISKNDYKKWRKIEMTQNQAYRDLEKRIALEYDNAQILANKMINSNNPELFYQSINSAMYQIEHDAGIDTSFTLYNKDTVKQLLIDDPDLLPKAKLAEGTLRWNVSKVNSALLQGILAGDSIENIAKRLEAVTNSNYASSVRTARTLSTSSENLGRLDGYKRAKNLGIKLEKTWIATVDKRTRHSHARLDGETVAIEDTFSNGLKYPADTNEEGVPLSEIYNCRCTMISKIKGFPMDLKNERVSEMDYDEWVEYHKKE